MCRGRQGVVSLKLDHRPHDNSHRRQRFLERMELGEQNWLDACAGFVVWPETVTKRLDDMIGRHSDVRGAVLDHLRNGMKNSGDGAERRIGFLKAPDSVEVTKKFVCAVDEVNDHSRLPVSAISVQIRSHSCQGVEDLFVSLRVNSWIVS